jgi:putative ABC transport system permease protein
MLGIVSGLIFFVTMFITLNTVLFLVRERRQALAAMRAIGFRSAQVFRLVAIEVIVLCLIGGALGMGLVLLLFHKGIPFGQGNLLVTVHLSALVAGTVVTLIIGIVASVIPSWIASRVDILGALRST